MRHTILRILLLLLSVVYFNLAVNRTSGDYIQNGGFENGLDYWTTKGNVEAVVTEPSRDTSLYPDWTPREGDYFAVLRSFGEETSYGLVSCLASYISQSFTANEGDILAFDYFVDYRDTGQHDIIQLAVSFAGGFGFSSEVIGGYNIGCPGTPVLEDNEVVPWRTEYFTLPNSSTGEYGLAFSIIDTNWNNMSILGVDNVRIIPVPSAVILGSLGIGFASWRLRKQRAA